MIGVAEEDDFCCGEEQLSGKADGEVDPVVQDLGPVFEQVQSESSSGVAMPDGATETAEAAETAEDAQVAEKAECEKDAEIRKAEAAWADMFEAMPVLPKVAVHGGR